MLLELIATIFAGFGAAGLALTARMLTANHLPRWTIPVFAGAGMLGFQIYSEYTWFEHQAGLLPEGVLVTKTHAETRAWKPWTYAYPQTLRFMALDTNSVAANPRNPEIILADLYFFERHHSAKRIPQVFHCTHRARADLTDDLHIPAPGEPLNNQWLALPFDDQLLSLACVNALSNMRTEEKAATEI